MTAFLIGLAIVVILGVTWVATGMIATSRQL